MSRLSTREKAYYGIGDLGGSVVFQSVALFALYYFTDVFGLSAAAAGLVLFVSKIWNATADPIVGFMSDQTASRWGRKRPFLLFGAIPLAIAYVILFWSPSLRSESQPWFAVLAYLGFSTTYSFVAVPYGSLTANMTLDSAERSSLTAWRMSFVILATLLVAGATLPFVNLFENPKIGFRVVAWVYAAMVIACSWATFWGVRERNVEAQLSDRGLKSAIRAVAANRPFLVLCLSLLLQMTAINILALTVNYYFKYVMHAETMTPVALTCLFVSAGLALPVWVFVSRKIGKKPSLSAGMGILFLALLSVSQVHEISLPRLIGALLVCGIGTSTLYLCPWSMVADTVEYSQWKLGTRNEGAIYGVFYACFKASAALAALISGFVLNSTGYIANAEQTATALSGIRLLMTALPAAFVGAGVAVLWFYEISESAHQKILNDLQTSAGIATPSEPRSSYSALPEAPDPRA